jgi:hypothetical protein
MLMNRFLIMVGVRVISKPLLAILNTDRFFTSRNTGSFQDLIIVKKIYDFNTERFFTKVTVQINENNLIFSREPRHFVGARKVMQCSSGSTMAPESSPLVISRYFVTCKSHVTLGGRD